MKDLTFIQTNFEDQVLFEKQLQDWTTPPWRSPGAPLRLGVALIEEVLFKQIQSSTVPAVERLVDLIVRFLDGKPIDLPVDLGPSFEARLYNFLPDISMEAKWNCWEHTASKHLFPVYYLLGESCIHLMRMLQKQLAQSTGSGLAYNVYLEPMIFGCLQLERDVTTLQVQKHRFHDFLYGRNLPAEQEERLRVYFTATMTRTSCSDAYTSCEELLKCGP